MDARRLEFDRIQSRRNAESGGLLGMAAKGRLSIPIATLERIAGEGIQLTDAWLRTMATDPLSIPTILRVKLYSKVLEELGEYVDEDAYRAQFSRPAAEIPQIQDKIVRQLALRDTLYVDLLLALRGYREEYVDFVLDKMVADNKASSTVNSRGLRVYHGNFNHWARFRIYQEGMKYFK